MTTDAIIFKHGKRPQFFNLINLLNAYKAHPGKIQVTVKSTSGETVYSISNYTVRELISMYERIQKQPITGVNHRDNDDHKMLSIFRLPVSQIQENSGLNIILSSKGD